MRKLTLALDQLAVASFDTSAARPAPEDRGPCTYWVSGCPPMR